MPKAKPATKKSLTPEKASTKAATNGNSLTSKISRAGKTKADHLVAIDAALERIRIKKIEIDAKIKNLVARLA